MNHTATPSGPGGDSEADVDPTLPPFPATTTELSAKMVCTALPVDHFGTTLYVKSWQHLQSERPPIVFVHDVGEHADCYVAAAQCFVERGYSVYLFDWRGHGRSGWLLGHAPSFQVLVKDLLQVVAWARYQEGGLAPILVGHGVGALVVMEFTKNYGNFCCAVVLSAPCLELLSEVSLTRRLLLKLLADMTPMLRLWAPFRPRFTNQRVSLHPISRDDPHLSAKFPGLTAALTYELVNAIKRAEARFIEYNGSVLILCPEKDAVCGYQYLKKSAAIHADHNLEILELAQTTHSVLTGEEGSRDAAVAAIAGWLSKISLTKPAASSVRSEVEPSANHGGEVNPIAVPEL